MFCKAARVRRETRLGEKWATHVEIGVDVTQHPSGCFGIFYNTPYLDTTNTTDVNRHCRLEARIKNTELEMKILNEMRKQHCWLVDDNTKKGTRVVARAATYRTGV